MAELDRVELKDRSDLLFADNTSQDISPQDKRQFDQDMIDSNLNITTTDAQVVDGPVDFTGGLTENGVGVHVLPVDAIVINTLEDFPTPIGGVIELCPGGLDQSYLVAVKNVDISPNVFSITTGTAYFRGYHPNESRITSSSTDPLVTVDNGAFRFDDMQWDCPNGDFMDFTGNGVSTFFVWGIGNIISCQNVALNITGCISSTVNRTVFLATSAGGFSFSGTDNGIISIKDATFGLSSGFLGWEGNMFDLGTATFNTIEFNNNKIFPQTGDVFLDGATLGANLKAGGTANLTGNLFNGAGNSVVNITGQDDGWLFAGNNFNDGVRNTRTSADTFLTSSETVTISASGTYVPVEGVNWESDVANHFTEDSAGILTYTGRPDSIGVMATATIDKVGGGSDKLCCQIAIDSGSGFVPQSKSISCTDNTTPATVVCQGLFELATGDKLQLFTANTQSTSNVIVSEANMVAKL